MKPLTTDPSSLLPYSLIIRGVIESDGRRIVVWNDHSRQRINKAKSDLEDAILPVISLSWPHMKGRCGVKGCIQDVQKHAARLMVHLCMIR